MEYHISGWEDCFVKKWQICGTESIVLQHNASIPKKCHKLVEKAWGEIEMEGKLGIYKNRKI